jgi:hypothetical protein
VDALVTTLAEAFRALGDDGYELEVPKLGTVLRLEGLRRVRGELVGELCVISRLPGIPAVDGRLSVADLNVSSARARVERARMLDDRARLNGQVDWTGLRARGTTRGPAVVAPAADARRGYRR